MEIICASDLNLYRDELADLLIEAVADGASIGFIAPVTLSEATSYWQQISAQLTESTQWIWLALDAGKLLGTVQLSVCNKANGSHRAEVEKLMVAKAARGKGVAKALMKALEAWACEHQLGLLVLDTKQGDVASFLYPKLGYQSGGVIPDFAKDGLGRMAATVYFYKQL